MKNLIKERLTNFYEANVKKAKDCPACKGVGKLAADNSRKLWHCSQCGYSISYEELQNDYMYWFCDECQALLNVQSGFENAEEQWICQECGYNNCIVQEEILGECKDCGKQISGDEKGLCAECRQIHAERREANLKKAKTLAIVAGKQILVIAATIAVNVAKKTISDYLKNINIDGVMDNETRTKALDKAKAIALSQMNEEMQDCIVKKSGNFDVWLTEQIDGAFNKLLAKV